MLWSVPNDIDPKTAWSREKQSASLPSLTGPAASISATAGPDDLPEVGLEPSLNLDTVNPSETPDRALGNPGG